MPNDPNANRVFVGYSHPNGSIDVVLEVVPQDHGAADLKAWLVSHWSMDGVPHLTDPGAAEGSQPWHDIYFDGGGDEPESLAAPIATLFCKPDGCSHWYLAGAPNDGRIYWHICGNDGLASTVALFQCAMHEAWHRVSVERRHDFNCPTLPAGWTRLLELPREVSDAD